MVRKKVAVLIYQDVQALDVAGPMDAFSAAVATNGSEAQLPAYEVFTVASAKRAVTAESGLALQPRYTFESCPQVDTLVIPGGSALRESQFAAKIAPWIAYQAKRTRRVAAICTGTFALAATGLLRDRRVTTHWRYATDLAGITAGIDLALALIEEDLGRAVSVQVARELVVYLRRAGGQDQYSEPLEFEAKSIDRFSDIAHWIATNLHRRITLEDMARRARLGPRQMSRRFQATFGATPAHFVESLRMKEAQRRLIVSEGSIKRVALSLGYRSAHVFRRAFERKFGLSPGAYRERFGGTKAIG